VYNVTPHAVGVIVYKVVGNRYIEKRVSLRVEHVRHSACRQEFLDRVQANHAKHVEAKEKGGELNPDFCWDIAWTHADTFVRTLRIAETGSCIAPGSTYRLSREKPSADNRPCSLRDYNLKSLRRFIMRLTVCMSSLPRLLILMHTCNKSHTEILWSHVNCCILSPSTTH
jgi:hypothetical protein